MIKNRITFKQLEAFVCVIDVGTFRKAADVLGTTQPNVSARISALENSLGVLLLHRDSGGVRLTEQGQALLTSARQVLWAGEAFLETAGRRDLVAERLRLGVTEVVASTWLHDFLREFSDLYPAVAVELVVDMSVEIEREMTAGGIDLALQSAPFQRPYPATFALGTCEYIWVAAPGVAKRLGDGGLQRLAEGTILTHARHSTASRELASVAKARGISTNRIVHSNSLTSCVQMATDGMGAALLPDAMVQEAINAGHLNILDSDWHPPKLEFFARFDDRRMPRFVHEAARMAVDAAQAYQKK